MAEAVTEPTDRNPTTTQKSRPMTQQEFNHKYKQWIPEGWSGLEFDVQEVNEYLDQVMQDLVLIPGFELQQCKMKFDWPRFYFTTDFKDKGLELAITVKVQEQIGAILKGRDLGKERWSRIMNKAQEGSTTLETDIKQ